MAVLASKRLKIGAWGEICDLEGKVAGAKVGSGRSHIELLNAAWGFAKWAYRGGWLIIQFDCSNSFNSDEISLLERLGLPANGPSQGQGETIFADLTESGERSTLLASVLVAYTALVQNWHIYLLSEHLYQGHRLGLLDGVAYCFADAAEFKYLESLLSSRADL